MNTDTLQRVTFVLDRVTADRLAFVADRLGLSRSALARELMAEPMQLMHKWVSELPPNPTRADAVGMLDTIAGDFTGWLESKSAQMDLLTGPTDGNA